jgi:adenosylcobinamide-phosphate synthase
MRSSWIHRPAAIALGFGIDRVFGEPPVRIHPVVGFGWIIKRLESAIYADERRAGLVMCAAGVGISAGTGLLLNRTLGTRFAATVSVALSVAGKMLADEALHVGSALQRGDLDSARERVVSLVGRSTGDLGETEIARAVVESLAENTIDAVIASLVWASVGGAPAVLAHRAINTLDAMVGHHSPRYEHFGWASARLDDVVNWLPARVGALAVATVTPSRAGKIWAVVRRDAPQHPSPNGGVIEAAYAAALDVQLGGTNRYGDRIEERGVLGDGRTIAVADIERAVALSRQIGLLCALILPLIGSLVAGGPKTVLRNRFERFGRIVS